MTAPLRSRPAGTLCLVWGIVLSIGCAHDGASTQTSGMFSLPEPAASRRATDHHIEEQLTDRTPLRSDAVAENLRRGHLEARAGRPDQAARFYERVLRDDPGNADAHHRLAVLADRDGDFVSSERNYLAALERRPDDADLLNDLGYSYLLQRRFAESARTLHHAAAIEPAHARVRTNLALLSQMTAEAERATALRATMPRSPVSASEPLPVTTPEHMSETIVLTGGTEAIELPLWTPPPARPVAGVETRHAGRSLLVE